MNELKPCPFCGRQPKWCKKSRDISTRTDGRIELEIIWWLECECGIKTESDISYYELNDEGKIVRNMAYVSKDGRGEVVRKWNTRAQEQVEEGLHE